MPPDRESAQVRFRDPATANRLAEQLIALTREIGRSPISIMHVCGSHEQAIARYGLRARFPRELDVIMGPGCPVCVTDALEVDEGVVLAEQGVLVATYGDMIRVPGSQKSLADAQSEGGNVHIVYSAAQAVEIARRNPEQQVVFYATGFETTAITTAAVILDNPPPNFSVLSAHKYVPPAMEIVAQNPNSRVEGFLAAGHAATVTGWGLFEQFAEKYRIPVVVAGFEPLDILSGLVELVTLVRDKQPKVVNMYPRCVTKEGNVAAQNTMWKVFKVASGMWRGIADIPDGNLRIRDEYAHVDARKRFSIPLLNTYAPREYADKCICGAIMSGMAKPTDCTLFGKECNAEKPVGACMVSSEGTCKIWFEYGGRPELTTVG